MRHILGLIAENNLVKTALLKEEKGNISLEFVKSFFSSDSLVKQLYISMPLPENGTFYTATALNPQDVLFRALSLPISDRKKALAALPFQLEGIIPFPLDEANIAASLTQMGKEAFSISLFAARDSAISSHLEWAQSLQIEPDCISCTPIAIYRLCRWLFPHENAFTMFHFGDTKSSCVISLKDEISLTQTLHFGHQDFLSALAKDLPEKSIDEIILIAQEPSLLAGLSEPLTHFNQVQERVQKELERLFCYLESKNATSQNPNWIVLGDRYPSFSYSSFFPKACLTDLSALSMPASIVHEYAIPIGTALDALAHDKHTVQFLQGKWIPKRQTEKRKKKAVRFAALCAASALLMGVGGHMLLKKKENALSQQLINCLPPTMAKNPPQSIEEWEETLWQWESSLNAQKLPFPFLPTVPTVSDVLAWLSSHPALSSPEGGKKEGVDIKSFRYQLYKHPKLGEAGGVYAAKVDLELTSATPRLAREFHDALLKGDRIVNAKKEIKWNA
ncbi:MAG: hypothetical protein JSR39_09250, partial [Verrucomicrobia bacterium]|nr:hypothetical protein [Verrucomicrobiota bacterium]